MGLSELLLSWVDTSVGRGLLRFSNKVLRLPRPVSLRVQDQQIYVASIDRLLAMLLTKFGNAERYEMSLWTSHLKPGMIVADIGANLGLYTLLAAPRVGPNGQVHSFEPDPSNFALLRRNVAANGYQNVRLHQAAVADEEGDAELHLCEEHHGDHRLYTSTHDNRPRIPVRVTTLDNALSAVGRLDLVKIDIQGSEWRAIDGMRRLIAANSQLKIFLEFWPSGLRESRGDPRGLLRCLRQLGLSLRHINSARAVLEDLDDAELIATAERQGYTNVLLARDAA